MDTSKSIFVHTNQLTELISLVGKDETSCVSLDLKELDRRYNVGDLK